SRRAGPPAATASPGKTSMTSSPRLSLSGVSPAGGATRRTPGPGDPPLLRRSGSRSAAARAHLPRLPGASVTDRLRFLRGRPRVPADVAPVAPIGDVGYTYVPQSRDRRPASGYHPTA